MSNSLIKLEKLSWENFLQLTNSLLCWVIYNLGSLGRGRKLESWERERERKYVTHIYV